MAKKKVRGRPRKEIDPDVLKNLCVIHATQEECAAFMEVSADTINRRLVEEGYEKGFPEFFERHSAGGKVSLRRRQYRKAVEDGDNTMLIWLGKQWLGQSDKHEHTGNFNVTIGGDDADL